MASGRKVDQVFITSKLGPRFHGREAAHEGCELALNQLKTDSLVFLSEACCMCKCEFRRI